MARVCGTGANRTILLAIVACGIFWTSIHAQTDSPSIIFQKEHIKVFVRAKSIRVDGLYTLVNPHPSPSRQALFYPFPVDSLHPREDYVLVRCRGRVIPTRNQKDGVVFGIVVPASGSLDVEVIYEQTCLDGSGCYILTSTAAWEAPLEHASFEIHVPDDIELDWMSYEADAVSREGRSRVYEFARDDFMPDRDLCLRWHVRESE